LSVLACFDSRDTHDGAAYQVVNVLEDELHATVFKGLTKGRVSYHAVYFLFANGVRVVKYDTRFLIDSPDDEKLNALVGKLGVKREQFVSIQQV